MPTDIYLSCADKTTLEAFCAAYANVISPAPGRPASAESIDENGEASAARPAAGDPLLYYACIRGELPPTVPEGIILCDTATGQAVLGVWA